MIPSFVYNPYPIEPIFLQPQFTRYHHAHRSPLNSEKLNLEAGQIRYDLFKLYEKINNLIINTNNAFTELGEFSDATPSILWDDGIASPVPNLSELGKRLEMLGRRLEIIEKGL